MFRRTSPWLAPIAALALLSPFAALAGDAAKSQAPLSTEQREKMAGVHQKMAECLRSQRALSECRAEMETSCHDMMGEAGCPMMGMGKGGMGPGMGHGMMGGAKGDPGTPPK